MSFHHFLHPKNHPFIYHHFNPFNHLNLILNHLNLNLDLINSLIITFGSNHLFHLIRFHHYLLII